MEQSKVCLAFYAERKKEKGVLEAWNFLKNLLTDSGTLSSLTREEEFNDMHFPFTTMNAPLAFIVCSSCPRTLLIHND